MNNKFVLTSIYVIAPLIVIHEMHGHDFKVPMPGFYKMVGSDVLVKDHKINQDASQNETGFKYQVTSFLSSLFGSNTLQVSPGSVFERDQDVAEAHSSSSENEALNDQFLFYTVLQQNQESDQRVIELFENDNKIGKTQTAFQEPNQTMQMPLTQNLQTTFVTNEKPIVTTSKENFIKPFSQQPSFAGNSGAASSLLHQIKDRCSSQNQQFIMQVFQFSPEEQEQILRQLGPQFKVAQFALEKLDLLLHKELEAILYENNQGIKPFFIAGYDYFKQRQDSYYLGYNVDNFYQMLGLGYNFTHVNTLYGIGVAESYMSLTPYPSKASYTTIYATAGVSKKYQRWQFGLDALFGYSFIHTKRHIEFLSAVATSNHPAWNLSFDAKISYELNEEHFTFIPYDNLSYLYGQERDYAEKGASFADLHVKHENISVIRNALGFHIKAPKDAWIQLFIDASWVYDGYLNDNTYQAAFIGSELYGTFRQKIPTRNYGRLNTGFYARNDKLQWKFAYTGLYGKNLSDNAVSFELSYEF